MPDIRGSHVEHEEGRRKRNFLWPLLGALAIGAALIALATNQDSNRQGIARDAPQETVRGEPGPN